MKKKSANYEIFVINDQNAQRQFRISKKALYLAAALLLMGASVFIGLSFYMFQGIYSDGKVRAQNDDLEQKRNKLLEDNDYLWATTSELERRLAEFQEKTDRLALMVGMEQTGQEDGVGGPALFGTPYDDYNRPDLGFLEKGMVTLEKRLGSLEEVFTTQTDLLDSTPSILPARGWLSSGFKFRTDPFTKKKTWHNGLDISCRRGTPIYAPAKGVVTKRVYQNGFGKMMEIAHGNGLITRYGHLNGFNVRKGARVNRGDLIGYVGSTGRSTAPHLHYEIHKDGKGMNPIKYVIRGGSGR